ncbi:MAG: tetratricopeptide repeat protein [Candidatus Xenobia bacterium]
MERLTITDQRLVSLIGKGVQVGQGFAFLEAGLLNRPGLQWLATLLGKRQSAAQVVSLLSPDAVDLPGASFAASPLGRMKLGVITSDKSLYREGHDTIHLLVVDPLAPRADVTLQVTLLGREVRQIPVRLNVHGAARVQVSDLPCGDYEVRFKDAPTTEPACAITVAQYRLAPLVASLLERSRHDEVLKVKLSLTSFGVPVEGAVQLELTEKLHREQPQTVTAENGVASGSFLLRGEGPHAINVQLVADPSRTATVPLVGTRASERSLTSVSRLGAEVNASLLPAPESTEVRGLYLEEGAYVNSPFRLDRVDTTRARLTCVTEADQVMVVVVDPTVHTAAVEDYGPHPRNDPYYKRGTELFEAGRFAEARDAFLEGRPWGTRPHPYWAYYVACCYARQGNTDEALIWLRLAVRDGFHERAHMASDTDLALLQDQPAFQALCEGGHVELRRARMGAGESWEIDVPSPAALLAIGAWVTGKPWEGWAATIAPVGSQAVLHVPQQATPGETVRIEVETGGASAYVVVKDARLLSADTPQSRLAGQIKTWIASAGEQLSSKPMTTLQDLAARMAPAQPTFQVPATRMMGGGPARARGGGFAGPPVPIVPLAAADLAWDAWAGAWDAPPPLPPPLEDAELSAPLDAPEAPAAWDAPPPPPQQSWEAPLPKGTPDAPGRPVEFFRKAPSTIDFNLVLAVAGSGPGHIARREPLAQPTPKRSAVEEPEVLLARLLEVTDGRASVEVTLGPEFTEYIVEALVIGGTDWKPLEARFVAARYPYVSLQVPPFLANGDGAVGRVTAGTTAAGMHVEVTCDGKPMVMREVTGTSAEVQFLVTPGVWIATVQDSDGGRHECRREVLPPGRMRHYTRTVKLLQPGESLSRHADPDIHGLTVLPGMDRPFQRLLHATAGYQHLCCEQTSARMLASAVEYLLATDDGDRDKAEAAVLAGIRREQSMHLPGRGFKFYPEAPAVPNTPYGRKAAINLRYLAVLQDAPHLTPALRAGIEDAIRMAEDALNAYGESWPDSKTDTPEAAYMALRFSPDTRVREQAVASARRHAAAIPKGKAVERRIDSAYCAATLQRARVDLPRALQLANEVFKDLRPDGNLHSTIDSVAAISLMAELQATGIGSKATAEINGRLVSTDQVLESAEPVREVVAKDGVVAIEVLRVVEEDWSRFSATVPLTVTLEKQGHPGRRFKVGDAVDLVVRLEGGYQAGDLVWFCLPDALTRVVGGGQVKRFAVDFAGSSQVRVPLVATNPTVDGRGEPGPQRWAVCVQNMYDEERAGNPGLLEVTVTGASIPTLAAV